MESSHFYDKGVEPMGRRPGRKPEPTPLGAAIRRLRQELNCSEAEFGRPSGLSGPVVHNLEKGWRKEPTRQEAEKLIAAGLKLPPAALDMADGFGRWVRAAASSPEPLSAEEEDTRRCEVAAGLIGLHVARELVPILLRQLREDRFARARQRAEERCRELREIATWEERRARIQSTEDLQTWACVEYLTEESIRAAADNAGKAIEWAKLALYTVPFVQGPDGQRELLEGWATFHLGNALRVKTDHRGSDKAFSKAWGLWSASRVDELPLDKGRPFDLHAALRREQRRFPEALDLHRCAEGISLDTGRVLLNKAATLDQMGDFDGAMEALQQARPYVEKSGEPRDLKVLFFNLSVAQRKLGNLTAAESFVPLIREVVLRLGGKELDLVRTLWNEGLIDAGLGRIAKGRAALEQVFEEMVGHGLPYDAALAGMDLAVLHLREGQTQEVLSLAGRIEQVFRVYGIEREALSALLIFSEAVRRETATVELARRTAEVIAKQRRAPRIPSYERQGNGEHGLGLLTAAAVGVHDAAGIPAGGRGGTALHSATPAGVHDAVDVAPEAGQLVPELGQEGGSRLLAPGLGGAPGSGEQDDENEQTRNARRSGHDGLLWGRPPRGHHGREGQFPESMVPVLENSRQRGPDGKGPTIEGLLAAVLVKRLHLKHGSFERVAQLVGVSRRTLWSYMAGRSTPGRETLAKLGEAAGIPAPQVERLTRLLRFNRLAERGGLVCADYEALAALGQPLAEVAAAVLEAVEEARALLAIEQQTGD